MRCSRGPSPLGYSMTLPACLVVTTAACSKRDQEELARRQVPRAQPVVLAQRGKPAQVSFRSVWQFRVTTPEEITEQKYAGASPRAKGRAHAFA